MNRRGFSLLEILVVLAVLGILLSIAALVGRDIIRKQNELSAVSQVKQLLWGAGSSVNARGTSGVLRRTGNKLEIIDTLTTSPNKTLSEVTLDSAVTTNLPSGDSLVFLSSGRIDSDTLAALPNPLTVTGAGKTFKLTVSVIGEVKFEVMP
jgi:prepilin-type N-terminal cleavage/methylation domain-containing protein